MEEARTGADSTVVADCFCVKCGKVFDGVIGRFTLTGPSVCPECVQKEEERRHKTNIAKIEIIVTWKGKTVSRTRKEEWLGKLSKEEILDEIAEAIDRIGEQ